MSGFGIISSSAFVDVPAPNRNSVLPSLLIYRVKRLAVFTNFNKKGAADEFADTSGEFTLLFSTSWKTVSCAKKGTSYQLFPSSSIHEVTSITLSLLKIILSNFTASPKTKSSEVLNPLSNVAFLVSVKCVGISPLVLETYQFLYQKKMRTQS